MEEGLFPCHLPPLEASRGVKGHKVGGSVEEELTGTTNSNQILCNIH